MPEAMLYEDMRASYNLAAQSEKYLSQAAASKIEMKTHGRAVRGTILDAYYFVEAYLNAIAFDYWWREQANLSEDDIDALLEWDSKRQRQRWLSLEEKNQPISTNHFACSALSSSAIELWGVEMSSGHRKENQGFHSSCIAKN
jgi:hypothetical protein